MNIIVCVKQVADGSINAFDLSALETALRLDPDKITVLTMGRPEAKGLLEELTRLGPVEAVLISGTAFAGSDSLATAYVLSSWISAQEYDLILCGRQSTDGETAQVGPEIAQMLGIPSVIRTLSVERSADGDTIICKHRDGETATSLPALVTMERSLNIRFPSIWSEKREVRVLTEEDLSIDAGRCGYGGSPTRVIASFEQESRRKCRWIDKEALPYVIDEILRDKSMTVKKAPPRDVGGHKERLDNLWITDLSLREAGEGLAENVEYVPVNYIEEFVEKARRESPKAILFPADWRSREIAPRAAAELRTGLCADCTSLMVENGELHMIRPAFGGRLYAKIKCMTAPVMATVRTASDDSGDDMIFSIGKGAVAFEKEIRAYAGEWRAGIAASRAAVEASDIGYEAQVGLTGRTVCPKIYLALGISGAVQHIAGMDRSRAVIAVNTDREADIFSQADYGIAADVREVLPFLKRTS